MKYAILAVLFVAESASAGLLAEVTFSAGDGFLTGSRLSPQTEMVLVWEMRNDQLGVASWENSVTPAHEGLTFVKTGQSGSIDWDLLSDFLTNGEDDEVNGGFRVTGEPSFPLFESSEAILFAGAVVPPPNGIDYEGFVIDQLTLTADVIHQHYHDAADVTHFASQFTVGIYGTQIPAPSAVWLLLLWPLTMNRRRKP